jgi:hypothetical protein
MTPDEAREILRRSRPGSKDTSEREVAAALERAGQDPALREWWAAEQEWRASMQGALRTIEPPESLRKRLGSLVEIPPPALPARRGGWLALAASVALLLGGSLWWWRTASSPARFDVWRQRMARAALREYRMDVATNSLPAVRQFLAGSTHDEQIPVPPEIGRLPVVGAKALRFQNQPVSLICFDRGGGRLLWFFAVNRTALPDAPPQRRLGSTGELATATWVEGDHLLMVAVEGDEPLLRSFLPP